MGFSARGDERCHAALPADLTLGHRSCKQKQPRGRDRRMRRGETAMNPWILLAQNAPSAPDIFGGAVGLVCLLWALGIAATLFWLWMLIDALVNEPTTNEKILWFLV